MRPETTSKQLIRLFIRQLPRIEDGIGLAADLNLDYASASSVPTSGLGFLGQQVMKLSGRVLIKKFLRNTTLIYDLYTMILVRA